MIKIPCSRFTEIHETKGQCMVGLVLERVCRIATSTLLSFGLEASILDKMSSESVQ